MIINAIIQCRMTSERFPGKVLAPILGKPILNLVIDQIRKTQINHSIILATSTDEADDPLSIYASQIGLDVIRGSRDNVVKRFTQTLHAHQCDAFFRICGDSPLLLPHLLDHAVSIYKQKKYDIITNIFPRTFPAGMSVELIKSETFLKTQEKIIDKDESEHLTKYFYNNSNSFQINNIECASTINLDYKLAIDELSDLKKVESWLLTKKDSDKNLFPIKILK